MLAPPSNVPASDTSASDPAVIVASSLAVAGKTAVTTPESTSFVAVAPATVKKFAATPVKV
jgi:hypothetical protein